MTPRDLIAAFDTLAEAPDGVKRLRELVLQLAVRGKLVPQAPDDEPASVLLERIAAEKAQLVNAKEIRKPRAVPELAADEFPFDVPEGWKWSRLAHFVLFDLTDGDWVESKDQDPDGEVRLTQLADVGIDAFLDKSSRFLNLTAATRLNCTYLQAGDVLIARLPRPLGRACIFPGLGQPAVTVVDVAIARCGESILNRYLVHVLNSLMVREQVESMAAGTTRKRISTGNLRRMMVPVAPFLEQKRIVARVDELMGLLDRLEAARNAREVTRTALRDAALAALRDADTPEEVDVAWERIAGRMDDLFTEPADVEPLRQTVLQLAVRGRLVPQDPEDEPAGVLLARIAVEKARLVKEKKIRKPKVLPPVSEDEVPFEVPEGWVWTRLEPVTSVVTSGSRGWNKFYAESGASFIRSQDIKYDRLEYDKRAFVQIPAGAEGSRTRVDSGDWLVTITGANVGKCAHVPSVADEAYVSQHVALLRPVDASLGRIGHYWLTAEYGGRGLLLDESYGAKPGLNLTQLRELAFPVPPVEEQDRIVTKMDQFFDLLGRLATRLTDKTAAHDAFAAAAVHHLDA